MTGIPYAETVMIQGMWFKVCPVCHAKIPLVKKKDFESFSGQEYADHYNARHA